MDQKIKAFESLLHGRSLNKALPLYARSKNNTSNVSAKEVLLHVSRQVKAIQNADTASCKQVTKTLEKYNKREFLPVDRIPVSREVPQRIATKFETQCVSDTQLIDVVDNAEMIDNHRGVTQEFDKTFCHKSDNDSDYKLNANSSKTVPIIDTHIENDINYPERSMSPKRHETLSNQDRRILNSPEFLTCEMDTVTCDNDTVTENKSQETQGFNTCMEIIDRVETDADRPTSPVLNAVKRNSTPPLVVDLYTFEKFENLAIPVIEEHGDLKLAKDMINSQIIGREITLPNRFNDTIGRDSPVFNKIERITTNINEEEVEKICTCSNNCVGRGMMSTNKEINKDENATSGNKKEDSKIAKTEINDEILFSSDEESEYLHKNVHELPLTCALETSFYDTSDVLDKTMFVGFQTASNKSIQINTDSFTKAKSILCGFDDESTETSLSELVEIFDSGRAISDKVQSIQMSTNGNQISSKVDKDIEKAVTSPFQITIGDKFRIVSSTALEKDEKVDDNINISQVIQFKSVLSNNLECSNDKQSFSKIAQEENRDSTHTCRNTDTIKTASLTELEPSEEFNKDFVISQVIKVKSTLKNKLDCGQTNSKTEQDENIASTLLRRNTPGSEETVHCSLKNVSLKALQQEGKMSKDTVMHQVIESKSMLGDKLECNYDTKNCSKIEQEVNRDSMPCENTDDTFSNASLTALERDSEVNEKDIISQVIEFKSTLKSKQDLVQTNPKIVKEAKKHLTESRRCSPHSGATLDITFKNVSLTALEQEKKADEDIVMSQVMSFKSTLRPAKLDDSICKQNTSDVFDKSTLLQQNKDMDDDIIMSLVIPFKSIASTPNTKNIRNARVNDESRTCMAIVKRKLEGFKTASNKKIKLSEKALARCKRVFKDIDLEDDNENSKPDFVESELDFIKDIKSDDFNLSYDHLKTNSEIDNMRQSENDMCDNVTDDASFEDPSNINEQKSKIDPNTAEQSCVENMDLQINDQILLQEFEDNEIPFEETNNNAFIDFKTASNKNIAISDAALTATKSLFQDITTISTTNYSDSAIKAVENTGIKSEKCDDNIFKKPSVDSRKVGLTKSNISTDCPIKFNPGKTQQKIEDDHRVINSSKKSKHVEFVGFEIASHEEIIISEYAKEKAKTVNKYLVELGLNNDDPKDTCNFNDKKKHNSEDDFNCGIDTQDFLAQVLTNIDNLSKENTMKNQTAASPIFQSFQIASRKPVVISEKALEMSNKLFEDITNKECVMQCNLTQNEIEEFNKTLSQDLVTPNYTSKESTQAINSKDSKKIADDLRVPLEGNSKENKTVAIKTQTHDIKESDIAKKLIKQFGLKGTECPLFVGFKTASAKPIHISTEAMEKTKRLLSDFELKDNEITFSKDNEVTLDTKPSSSTYVGFKNASNKNITVSTKALAKTKQMLNKFELKDDSTQFNDDKVETTTDNALDRFETNNEFENDFTNDCSTPSTTTFIGLQPGSNTDVNISEEALTKSRPIYQPKENDQWKREDTSVFSGFQTASNKKVEISADALAKSRHLFKDMNVSQIVKKLKPIVKSDENNEITVTKEPVYITNSLGDFQTANNKKVTLSARGSNNFAEDDASPFKGFQTASNKKVEISDIALAKSKKLFEDFNLSQLKTDPKITEDIPSNDFGGFQTASNKNVNVSEEALSRSKDIFRDIHLESSTKNTAPVFKGFQTASDKKVVISEKALAKSKKLFDGINMSQQDNYITSTEDIPATDFGGFQTASNRKVEVSEEALSKTKDIISTMNEEKDNYNIANDTILMFKGFQTANKKKVEISDIALAKSKKLFEDFNLSQLKTDPKITEDIPSNGFGGFQTASNKKVNVSEEALSRSKDIFRDIHLESSTKNTAPAFKGFQTASDKKVVISEKALVKSRKLFDGINMSQQDNYITSTDFGGFQTPSNRNVEVSEEALSKTKDIFSTINEEKDKNNIANDTILMFKGFQTASNKKVEISDKALANSKKLFEDFNLSQLKTDPKITEDIPSNDFGGFITASNKKVNISEESLSRSKDIFRDTHLESCTKNTAPAFKGFQTASDKKVVISEMALAKSKKLFEDINLSQLSKEPIITNSNELHKQEKKVNYMEETDNKFGSFQTANNKRVKVSQQALSKSRDTFSNNFETPDDKKDVHPAFDNVKVGSTDDFKVSKELLDTQVLNDFQETLNTEDFGKTTPTSKRSGSPILSCPKAKKRKFATPYRTTKKKEAKAFVPPKIAKTYNFNNNYKKEKKYTLKDIQKLEKENVTTDFDPYITEFNFDNLLNFEFKGERIDVNTKKMTIDDLKKIFLGSINQKIVPDGWLDDHIKLIVWKLLSYEVKFPNVMKNICTVKNVLEQLKYRYDRELYHVRRPILRKILEKDEVASKTMVLCVAAVYIDNISVTSVTQTSQNVELLLTDGWYCVKACLDRMLTRLVTIGAIVVGTKLAVCGAELLNCEQGIAPWEDTSSVRLKLHGNGVRRAHWLARLGPRRELIQCPLHGAKSDGGKMAAVRVIVTRMYPPLYVEKMEDGSTVTLSERLEHMRQVKYESERQIIMEKLYEEVEKEMSDQDSQDSEGYSNDKSCLDSGSQISKRMKESKDPDEYRSHLTISQTRMLEDHSAKQREKLIERVRQKFQQKLDKNGLTDRNVIPLLKVRVAGLLEKRANVEVTKGYLAIWKPSAAVLELLTEGAWIEILNLIPTGIRNSEIQLSAGRQTIFNPYRQTDEKFQLFTNTLQRKCYEIKEITHNPSMTTDYNEIDTVGMIFCIEPSTKDFKEQSFQNVYLADADKNIICVNFWGGLKKFGYHNVLDTGQIITCVNLQKRAGNTRKSIPQYRATELSYFTKTPKYRKALEITNELGSKLMKIKEKFCEDCLFIKSNYTIFKTRDSDVSPYRFEYNVPNNMVTPLRNCDANLNLTGLDFESSFNSQEVSPQMLLRKKRVNEKIEKIRLNYGEPPPLSSIHIINKSKNASATYKSPLISNLERSNMAESSLQNVASPVTINRTFVKNVNPVKLNFSSENLDESVDHFAEDFDASPPLSLDSEVLN